MSITPAEQITAEFAKARSVVQTAWVEVEVLAALSRAEAVALLAVGATLCPPLPPDHIAVEPGELWP